MAVSRMTLPAPFSAKRSTDWLDASGDAFIESCHVFQCRPGPFDLHYSNPSLRIASA